MKIRKANLKDISKIDEIYSEGSTDEVRYQFPDVSKKEYEKDLKKYQNSRRQGFKKSMGNKKHYWIVAEINNQIVAYGQAWIKKEDTGITESVYVDKRFRKKGIGKKIMKELIRWLKKKKMKYIESSCYVKNKPSVKLHEVLGFKPILIRMRLK